MNTAIDRDHDGGMARGAIRVVLVIVLVLGLMHLRHELFNEGAAHRPQFQRVRLLDAPKPPPPPKVEEDKKPVEVKEELREDKWTAAPADPYVSASPGPPDPGGPPIGDRLGVDEEGAGGGDAFGLVARRGGHDITTIKNELGGGGSGNGSGAGRGTGSPWAWYGGVVERHLQKAIGSDERLHKHEFQVLVLVWVSPEGRISHFNLLDSTGFDDIDQALKEVLSRVPPLRTLPPSDLPQPVGLRITSRGVG